MDFVSDIPDFPGLQNTEKMPFDVGIVLQRLVFFEKHIGAVLAEIANARLDQFSGLFDVHVLGCGNNLDMGVVLQGLPYFFDLFSNSHL